MRRAAAVSSSDRIGDEFITNRVRDCGNEPGLVLPNFNWSRIKLVRMDVGQPGARAIGEKTDPAAVKDALACRN